jgi:hypothetical protein
MCVAAWRRESEWIRQVQRQLGHRRIFEIEDNYVQGLVLIIKCRTYFNTWGCTGYRTFLQLELHSTTLHCSSKRPREPVTVNATLSAKVPNRRYCCHALGYASDSGDLSRHLASLR